MELFTAAGVELPRQGRARRAAPARAAPLFNARVLSEAFTRAAARFSPTSEQTGAAADYARKVRDPKFNAKEVAVRPVFITDVLQTVLGWTPYDPGRPYTLASERPIRGGAVDVALGRFNNPEAPDQLLAPFELKGPRSVDLDRVDPGRGRSPVQQAWDYAVDSPGSRWVLVSNCLEIRLYAFGRGRDAYERFDLSKLDQRREHERLWLILSAAHLLSGATDTLLRDTDEAYQQVTDDLYRQYSTLRRHLIDFLTGDASGPQLARLPAIETAQTLLDRVLFVAFAGRTDLLPPQLLDQAAKDQSRFNPQPLWTNFQALFRAVDVGSDRLGIPAYNGGLFAPDPVADALVLPDHLAIEVAALGRWDYRHEVPVTVLGHIFEQSITEIEADKASTRGEDAPAVSRRKREGVVYTPAAITRFLVERTVGVSLDERFAALRAQHGLQDPPRLAGEEDHEVAQGAETLNERAYWRACLQTLQDFTAVDPACGSGAFLVAAFDQLARRYRDVVSALEALGEEPDLDIFDWIVTRNLHGVDLNPESVEITRLSLWLKTARRDHKLQHLTATVRDGNSLIADPAYAAKPFDWRAAFPDVFARGGFDVVIGNPPYVRMELLKAVKPYLAQHYAVADERTDLYAYFFEKGVQVLKPGGRLGFISSSTFFRTGSGRNLRTLLTGEAALEAVIDFGEVQLFPGVTTYPAILTMRKVEDGGPGAFPPPLAGEGDHEVVEGAAPSDTADTGSLHFLNIAGTPPHDLDRAFREGAAAMPRARLTAGSWQFEGAPLAALRAKITAGRPTLGEVYGPPLYGIKTGLNDAFVIDRVTRDRLVERDPRSAELLKPFLRGEDVKRWRVESADLFLINTPRGRVDIETYPAIRDHLVPFRDELEQRATKQEWWELQQAQAAYQASFLKPKLVFQRFQSAPEFCLDDAGLFPNNALWTIDGADLILLAQLNSSLAHFYFRSQTTALSGGFYQINAHQLVGHPLIDADGQARESLAEPARTATTAAVERLAIDHDVRDRILDLADTPRRKLPRALEGWHGLEWKALQAALKSALKVEIKPAKQGEWKTFFADSAARHRALSARIAAAERDIDTAVYALFDLTPDEIVLLESAIT